MRRLLLLLGAFLLIGFPMPGAQAQTIIKKSNPQSRGLGFLMVDSSSSTSAGKTGLTGASVGTAVNVVAGVAGSFTSITYTPLVTGATTTNCSGTITEIKAGLYLYVPTATEANTNYDVEFIAQATGAIDYIAQAAFWAYKVDDLGAAIVPNMGAVNGSGSTTTVINTNLTATAANCFKGQVMVFGSGTDIGQTSLVVSNTSGANCAITVLTAYSSAPANTDAFYLVTGIGQKMADSLNTGFTLASTQSYNNTGSVGSISGVAFPTNFGLLGVDGAGKVTFNNASIGSVTGSVGSISGITFPSNFGTFAIDASGRVTLTPAEHTSVAGDVLNAAGSSYNTAGSIGQKINSAGSAGNPWTTDISTGYTGTQAGNILYAIRSGQPVTVGTNNDKTGYSLAVAPPTLAQITGLFPSDYLSSGEQAQLTGIKSQTDKFGFTGTGPYTVNATGGGSDPFAQSFPGSYASGTWGYWFQNSLAASVWSVGTRALTVPVQVDLTTPLTGTGWTSATMGDALKAAYTGQGWSKIVISGTTLTLYAADGVTVAKTFTLSPTPTAATKQ